MRISVRVTRISAERLIDPDDPIPKDLKVSLNMNLGKFELRDGRIEGRFITDVGYLPPIARVTIEGVVRVEGGDDELKQSYNEIQGGRIPQFLLQAVYTVGLSELVIVCRSIGIPPPLPSPPAPEGKVEGDIEYSA